MPIAAQLFASPLSRAASNFSKTSLDLSANSASSDQSFSDALQAARQSSNSSDADTQSAPPPSTPSSAASTPSTADENDAPDDASSDTTAHDTPSATPTPADPTAKPIASDSPQDPAAKNPVKGKPTDPLQPAAPDLAAQAALSTLLPIHLPPLKPQAVKHAVTTDASALPAAPQTVPLTPLKPQPHSAKNTKGIPTQQESSKTADAPKTPAIDADTTPLSQEPAPETPSDATLAANDATSAPAKDPLAVKPDSNITPATTTNSVPQPINPDAAATIAAMSTDAASASKPAISTLDSPSSASPSDPSSSSLALNSPPPLTSHAAHAQSASSAQDLPRTDPAQTYDQIVLGLRTKLDANNQTAEIHLNPPNLGSLHVSVQLTNGSLTASFNSQSDVVRDLLKSNMDKLKSVLQDQGIAVDKLNVNTVANSSQSSPDRNPNSGSAPHDGRSAGYSQQDSSNQKRSAKDSNTNSFVRAWKNATKDNPIDLVA